MEKISLENLNKHINAGEIFYGVHVSPVEFAEGDVIAALRRAKLKEKRLYHQKAEEILERARLERFKDQPSRLDSVYILPVEPGKSHDKISEIAEFRKISYQTTRISFEEDPSLEKVHLYRAAIDPKQGHTGVYNGDWEQAIIAALLLERELKNNQAAVNELQEYIKMAAENYWGKAMVGPYPDSPWLEILTPYIVVESKIGEITREEFGELERELKAEARAEFLPQELKELKRKYLSEHQEYKRELRPR